MNKVKIIKKIKAWVIRMKIHRPLGFLANLLIYAGYLIKLSAWAEKNRPRLWMNDFYNGKVKHKDREKLYAQYAEKKKLENCQLNYLEFGVGHGNSLRWWTNTNNHEASRFWAFDTYEGLPEKYGNYEVGTFSLEGKFPEIDDQRIHFIKGLFQDTLLKTISEIDFTGTTIIHIDADLYSAALYVLGILYPYLKKGDILIFDEFSVPGHEFKAFDDFIKSFYIELVPIGAINNYLQVIFEVKNIG